MRGRFRRFNSTRREPVSVSRLTQRKKGKCAHCQQELPAGQIAVVLRLKKRFKAPCATCGKKPRASRRYHEACFVHVTDVNAEMHVDPNAVPAQPVARGGAVPPPTKPMTAREASFAALVAVEAAFKRRLAESPALQASSDIESALKTYNGCKARALRPGTDAEGVVALKMSLKKVIDLVF